jgi:endogenous inhibitor of DNA gyrase (YacG/DUF329 family)
MHTLPVPRPKRVKEVDRKALQQRVAARLEPCRRCGKVAEGINVILGPSCSKACTEAYFQGWKQEQLEGC